MSTVAPAPRLVELDRRVLRSRPFHVLEDTRTGRLYFPVRSSIADPRWSPGRVFYRDDRDEVVFLELVPGMSESDDE